MSAPTRRARLVGLVALAALTSGCGFSLQAFPKLGTQTGSGYPIHASFADVLNLPADAQVRDGSAVVGQVSAISTSAFRADLTFKIRTAVRIPVGTTAEVRFDSPLGDEYVLLSPPAGSTKGPYIAPGGSLPVDATSTAPTVEDTLTVLGSVLNGGGIDQLQTIIVELNRTFTGNQSQIRTLLGQVAVSLRSLADHSGDLDGALAAVGSLARQLNSGSAVITSGIDAIAPAVTVLADENGDLDALLRQLTRLSTVTNRLVDVSGQDGVDAVHQLLPVVDQLVGVEQQLGPDLTDLSRFEAATPKIAPGNYLQVSLNLSTSFNSSPVDATAPTDATPDVTLPDEAAPDTTSGAVTTLLEGGLR
jgi:phospholipid/cholesterol/gamma-HCH transport system substrate-binding protein